MNIDYKGKILQFPDGMPTEQIEMAIRQMEQSEAPQVAPSETKAEPGFFSAENWTPEGSVGDIYETFTGGVQDAATFGLADKARDVGRVAGQYLTPESLGGEAGWGMTALQKAIMDQFLTGQDWDDRAKIMLERKEEWHHLGFFEQSEWKTRFFEIEKERFKMVLWN